MRFRDWVTAISGLAAIAVSVFVVGGVLRWSQALVALLVAIALAATLVSRRSIGRVSPLVAMFGVALFFTGIQLIPLPDGALDVLAPTTSALRADGADLLGLSPWQAITTDSPATISAFVFFALLLGIAFVSLRMAVTERGRYRLLASIGGVCGLTALIVGIHELFGLRALYGLYEPEQARPLMMGPLLNGNSLACLMAVGAILAIGLAAYRRQSGWLRVLWVVVVCACGAITVSTVSRGATLAFIAGAIVTIAVIIGQRVLGQEVSRRRRLRFMTNALPIGVLGGCVVILVMYLNAGDVERQLAQLSVEDLSQSQSKFAAWRSGLTLVEEAPWLGIGRGAFEASFTRVHPASGVATYSHLENEYLQAVVDWGVPAAIAFGFAAIWMALVAIRRWRDGPLTAAALGAVTVVAVQSNVDFGLEVLGLAAPITVIAATLTYVPLRDATRLGLTRGARILHVVALVVGALLLLSSVTKTLDEDHRELRQRPTIATVRESLERHPLDYYGYAVTAELLDRAGDRRAIKLLNHAFLLHPTHPGLHRMAARMLYRDGFVEQAAVEYATALRFMRDPTKLLREVLPRFPDEIAATAIPVDFPKPQIMVQTLTDLGRSNVAIRWLDRLLEQRPKNGHACELLYKIVIRDQNIGAAEIAGKRCANHQPDYQARLAIAQMLASKQGHAEVIRLLEDVESWQSRVDDKITGWLAVCDAHAALGHWDEAKRCLRHLDASGDMRPERRGEILKRLEEQQKAREQRELTGSAAAQ